MNIQEIIREHIEEENSDLKYKIGDKLERLQFNMTPTIAYDYLLTDIKNQYSFLHPDLNKCQCEDLPDIWQFALYTNKKDNRAPRILFFIGNLGIIYILAFDQWHKTSLMGGK